MFFGRPLLSLIFASLTLASARAQDVNGDGLVTYLVPINAPQPVAGMYGTVWQTELWVYNGSSVPIALRGCGNIIDGTPCNPATHNPGVTEQAFGRETSSTTGPVLLNVSSNLAASLGFSSRLFEVSRHTQPAGVYMPVIREDRFFSTGSRFVGIPGSLTSRVALRLYDPRRRSGSTVRLEVITSDGTALVDTVLPLLYNDIPDEPGYATISDIAASFPQLAGTQRFDIRITPLTPGMEYWALVSVTDRDTQQVLLITAD
jgi:hypothetical protein